MTVWKAEADERYEVLVENKSGRIIKEYGGSLMMVEVFFKDYYESDEHTHVHEQMTYCLEGEFDFYVEGEVRHIKTGETIYFPSNVKHYCRATTETGRLLDVFSPIREDFLK